MKESAQTDVVDRAMADLVMTHHDKNAGEFVVAELVNAGDRESPASSTTSARPTRERSNSVGESSIGSANSEMCEGFPATTDVVIIGAGPSGLTLACELARRDINFLIFDINARAVTQSRALMLQSRTLEILADLGLTGPAVLSGHIVRGSRMIINDKSILDLRFTGVQSPFPFALVLEQSQTERMLIDHLAELGHNVKRPVAVWKVEVPEIKDESSSYLAAAAFSTAPGNVSMMLAAHNALADTSPLRSSGTQPSVTMLNSFSMTPVAGDAVSAVKTLPRFLSDQSCVVHVKPLDFYGKPMEYPNKQLALDLQIRCKYVVGCDGARSSVRRAVDIAFEPRSEPTEYLVADIAVQWGIELSLDRMHLIQNQNGVLIFLPMPENRWRMICMRKCLPDYNDALEPFHRLQVPESSEIQQILEAFVPGSRLQGSFWVSAFSVNCHIAETFRRSSVILCGDAAHCHPPTFGQGMNTGIQDAYNLGWKLAAVVRGASPELLNTYSCERREVAEEIARQTRSVLEAFIRPTIAFRCLIGALGSVLGGMDYFTNSFSKAVCQTDLEYSQSLIVGQNYLGRGTVAPGVRLPSASIVSLPFGSDDTNGCEIPRPLVNYLHGGHHTLLLCVHVLPVGTKARTIFGCERNEAAVRWSSRCLEKLVRLARLLSETFRGRGAQADHNSLRVVWVLCGLVNFRSPKNNIGFGQIRDHVPHRLVYFFSQGSRGGHCSAVTVDYEDGVHTTLGLRLADPDSSLAAEKSGAFILVRPDGHVACNGYAGDPQAAGFAFDYSLNWLSE